MPLQVVTDAENVAVSAVGEKLRQEWVVEVKGKLRTRKDPNARLPTGQVELMASSITVLNTVTTSLPFSVSESDSQAPPRCGPSLRTLSLDPLRAQKFLRTLSAEF